MHGLFFYDTYDFNKHEKGLGLPGIPWKQSMEFKWDQDQSATIILAKQFITPQSNAPHFSQDFSSFLSVELDLRKIGKEPHNCTAVVWIFYKVFRVFEKKSMNRMNEIGSK